MICELFGAGLFDGAESLALAVRSALLAGPQRGRGELDHIKAILQRIQDLEIRRVKVRALHLGVLVRAGAGVDALAWCA